MTNTPTTRETADHAELAACPFCGGTAKSETLGHGKSARTGVKCADVDCPGSMRLVGADEDGVAFWNRRPCEAALLSEIAALRGEVERVQRECDEMALHGFQAVQAERQRDELRKALERIAYTPDGEDGLSLNECVDLARQTIANQGADQ